MQGRVGDDVLLVIMRGASANANANANANFEEQPALSCFTVGREGSWEYIFTIGLRSDVYFWMTMCKRLAMA